MKKIIAIVGVICVLLLVQGCTSSMKTSFDGIISKVIKKDQEKTQGFEVTKELVYENFREEPGYIGMKDMDLSEVPDFCTLLDEGDHAKVKTINLQNNNIKLVNQDLGCLTNIESINIGYNDVDAVRTLGDIPSLKTLRLNKNNISSLINFPELEGLENLSLSFNKLKDTAGIENLKNLVTLELAHNQIETLVGVENMEKLQALKVEFNKLKDLDSIEDLENLEFVSAAKNQLKEKLLEEMNEMNKGFLDKILGESKGGAIGGIPVIDLTGENNN